MKVVIKYLRLGLPHLGIVLVVMSMGLGYFYNWKGKAVLLTSDKTNVFITKKKEIKIVPFALTLALFKVNCYETGEPQNFEAIIDIEENDNTKSVSLLVNHPCKMGFGQYLYLLSYDTQNEKPEYCVVELVYEPFQGAFLGGIILVMVGLGLGIFPCRRLR
jgi:hypothetical protein